MWPVMSEENSMNVTCTNLDCMYAHIELCYTQESQPHRNIHVPISVGQSKGKQGYKSDASLKRGIQLVKS